MDVGGWELRDDLDVDLVVNLGIPRAAGREKGKEAERRENELSSATAPIAWSQESDKRNRETSRNSAKLSSLEAK